jgi:hypothetical protein
MPPERQVSRISHLLVTCDAIKPWVPIGIRVTDAIHVCCQGIGRRRRTRCAVLLSQAHALRQAEALLPMRRSPRGLAVADVGRGPPGARQPLGEACAACGRQVHTGLQFCLQVHPRKLRFVRLLCDAPVSHACRTDNAVKNRWAVLCKKAAHRPSRKSASAASQSPPARPAVLQPATPQPPPTKNVRLSSGDVALLWPTA